MKILIFTCLFLFLCAAIPVRAQSSLEDLYENQQYFALRDEINRQPRSRDILFYRGVVANRFNRLDESRALLSTYLAGKNTPKACEAYETLADDHIRKYRYRQAAEAYKMQMDSCRSELNDEEMGEVKNSYGLWKALETVPVQTWSATGPLKIQGTRDKAKLLNVAVDVGRIRTNFVFDTGANLSTITTSTAKKLGLTIVEAAVSVSSSSDIKVNSKLAVAPLLRIGNIMVRNVVFLVLDDKSLYFPQINYQIDGIIGFPVIEALGKITISRTDEIEINKPGKVVDSEPNMCLEDLKPLVEAMVDGKKMIFLFDSGAVSTSFYPAFFRADRERITKTAEQKKVRIGGAGGFKEVTAYFMPTIDMEIGGKTARFSKAEILTEPVNDESRKFCGNLGQDLIKQFDSMTLDFRRMQLIFR